MTDTWFTSDQHFGHANILKFRDKFGIKLRPEFDNVDQMNESILENHNSVVKTNDLVIHLGDIIWPDTDTRLLSQLHGRRRLCVGNHDRVKDIAWAFERIGLWHKFEVSGLKFIASHTPLAETDMIRVDYHVHGHTHEKDMVLADGSIDPRYLNVCVEKMGYHPVHIDDVVDLCRLYPVEKETVANHPRIVT